MVNQKQYTDLNGNMQIINNFTHIFRKFKTCIFIHSKTNNRNQMANEHILHTGEIIRQIEGFSDYWIGNFGNIYSIHYKTKNKSKLNLPADLKQIKLSIGKEKSRRYDYANIYTNEGYRASIRVHRLVYQYHNDNNDCLREGFIIDHIDGNKKNNHISNLRQITQQENIIAYHKLKKSNEVK